MKRSSLGLLLGSLIVPLAFQVACGKDTDEGSVIGPDDISGGGGASSGSGGGKNGSGGEDPGSGGILGFADSGMGRPPQNPDGSCGQSVIESQQRKVNVLVVLDRSGSMSATLEQGTRWTSLKAALTTSLGETKDAIHYGLDFFPSAGCDVKADPALDVAIADGPTSVPAISSALDAAGPVSQGGTPTAAALRRAVAYYDSEAGKALEGDRFVLLATDGGPNCNATHAACPASACVVNMERACPIPNDGNCCAGDTANCLDDSETLAQVEALAALGVHTFVVGIPGTEAFATALNAFAVAGKEPRAGTTKYYAVTSGAELTDTLRGITRSLVKSCDLELQSPPPDPDAVNVEIDGVVVPQEGADGWDLDMTASPPVVRLKGATCAAVESSGADEVRIVYGCPTVRVR